MRFKFLKGRLKPGRLAVGVSLGVMIARPVINRIVRKVEKEIAAEEEATGEVSRGSARKLRGLRAATAVLRFL